MRERLGGLGQPPVAALWSHEETTTGRGDARDRRVWDWARLDAFRKRPEAEAEAACALAKRGSRRGRADNQGA
ncbi:MAG: hypothetical protein CFK52_12245 [Chloracidobacterium sp. CP2_5A]|nr:MAG: hypothetical protein CFK52_12245 [Chloracidobacterium sp. CP2_5A]